MAFCTFLTSSLLPVGSIVKKEGASVALHDGAAGSVLVGVVRRAYESEDATCYAEVHLGGGVAEAQLSGVWDGLFSPLTVDGSGIRPALDGEPKHGYLIPKLSTAQHVAGDIVGIYWRGEV